MNIDFDNVIDKAVENLKQDPKYFSSIKQLHTKNIDDLVLITSLLLSEDFKEQVYKILSEEINNQ